MRDSRFKSDVRGGYCFTCALPVYRPDTESSTIVQAARIHQHAVSCNEDPRNGLALTPDAYRMFDAGLWTAIPQRDDFLIQLNHGRFTESSPYGHLLASRANEPLHFHALARIGASTESDYSGNARAASLQISCTYVIA